MSIIVARHPAIKRPPIVRPKPKPRPQPTAVNPRVLWPSWTDAEIIGLGPDAEPIAPTATDLMLEAAWQAGYQHAEPRPPAGLEAAALGEWWRAFNVAYLRRLSDDLIIDAHPAGCAS